MSTLRTSFPIKIMNDEFTIKYYGCRNPRINYYAVPPHGRLHAEFDTISSSELPPTQLIAMRRMSTYVEILRKY